MDETKTPAAQLATALAAAQAEIKDPGKARKGQVKGKTDYRYAGLDDTLAAIRPPLSKHGLSVSQCIEYREGKAFLVSSLLHSAGGERRSEWLLASGSDPQARGSELTYARRYTLEGLVGVAPTEDDDDGQAAATAAKGETPNRRKEPEDVKQARQDAHDPSWEKEKGKFFVDLKALNLAYDAVADMCAWIGRPRPSNMTTEQRAKLLDFLRTEAGAVKYQAYLDHRFEQETADMPPEEGS